MQISIKVDRKQVLAALKRAPLSYKKTIRKEMKRQMTEVATEAKSHHNFTTRGGKLEQSILTQVSDGGFVGRVYLEQGIAPYARRIHEGGGGLKDSLGRRMTNKPDKFLYQAFERLTDNIISGLKLAMYKGLKRAGL